MGALLLVGLLFLIIGVGLLIGGIVAFVKQTRKDARSVSATGRVINLERRVFNPGRAGVYCPVVQFTASDGQVIQFESAFGTMPASHSIGQTIAVKYDPANPRAAEVDSAVANWFAPGCMALMGVAFLLMGFVFVVMSILVIANQPN